MEITDDMIKAKHRQFNARIVAALNRKAGNTTAGQFSPAIQSLRQLTQLRKPTFGRLSRG